MKLTGLLFIIAIALSGCSKKEFRDAGNGKVTFADADVSIDVGPGWLRIDGVPEGMCSPTLAGKAGLIQVYWARAEFPTVEAVIAKAKKDNPGAIGEESEFRSEAGMAGRIYSVAMHPTKSGEAKNRATTIVMATRSGRILIMDLIGPDGPLHKSTREAITHTLAFAQK